MICFFGGHFFLSFFLSFSASVYLSIAMVFCFFFVLKKKNDQPNKFNEYAFSSSFFHHNNKPPQNNRKNPASRSIYRRILECLYMYV